jgi:hypothetical protein
MIFWHLFWTFQHVVKLSLMETLEPLATNEFSLSELSGSN